MNADTETLSIGEVAEATGLSVDALRFFEREGLLPRPIPRAASGHRVYRQADVEWLVMCNRFRDSGMPIATIREFVRLVRSGPGNEATRLAILKEHEQNLRSRIAELNTSLDVIHGKVVTYEQHVRSGTAAGLWTSEPPR